ncbi:MAG: hypothetical protein J6C50_01770 [Rickettsiales bacterium]|nr:hypothetical protein [Rickettsiales bacterium]
MALFKKQNKTKASQRSHSKATGKSGLKIPSKMEQSLFGRPCHKICSSVPTIDSKSDFAY